MAFGAGDILAVPNYQNSDTYLWDILTKKRVATFAEPGSDAYAPDTVAFGPNGTLAVGGDNGDTCLWDTATRKLMTKKLIGTVTGPASQGVSTVAFGPGGILAVADLSGNTYRWHLTPHPA